MTGEQLLPVEPLQPGVCYRPGKPTVADYNEAIESLTEARDQLASGCLMGCSVCGDSGHAAQDGCHHDPLVLARQWAAATHVWQCYHCSYTATNDEEAREHFGKNEFDVAACLASTPTALPGAEDVALRARRAIDGFRDAVKNTTLAHVTTAQDQYKDQRLVEEQEARATLAALIPRASDEVPANPVGEGLRLPSEPTPEIIAAMKWDGCLISTKGLERAYRQLARHFTNRTIS